MCDHPEPAQIPSLLEVQGDLTLLGRLPLSALVCLRRQVNHLASDIDAALFSALGQSRLPDDDTRLDRLLSPEAAADRFGVTRRWLLDHADQIPGVKRLSRKVVRFSEQHLERFLARAGI
jgi:hypothetical protein